MYHLITLRIFITSENIKNIINRGTGYSQSLQAHNQICFTSLKKTNKQKKRLLNLLSYPCLNKDTLCTQAQKCATDMTAILAKPACQIARSASYCSLHGIYQVWASALPTLMLTWKGNTIFQLSIVPSVKSLLAALKFVNQKQKNAPVLQHKELLHRTEG